MLNQRADRDWPHRRLSAQAACHRGTAVVRVGGNDLRGGELTIPPLTTPHPDTPERFDAIDLTSAEIDGLT